MKTLESLRNEHQKFIYESYSWKIVANVLEIDFVFKLTSQDDAVEFQPSISVPLLTEYAQECRSNLDDKKIDAYVFNLGLAEMLSYWKLAASPEIEVVAGSLSKDQTGWWHKLLIKGMGEYFFVNKIDFTPEDFVKITASENGGVVPNNLSTREESTQPAKILVPIGGGKDSAVTLELLKNNLEVGTFMVNPTKAALDTAKTSGVREQIQVKRVLDPKLLELNKEGYLNGHVPISALFAFLSIFVADIFGYNQVAISNEHSSNEGNVQFLGHEINHQYSKTFEFESDFQNYVKQNIPGGAPLYFSFLRPLYELQIARIFAGNLENTTQLRSHHQTFRSCNRGQKTNSWCGECSKCLFAFVILYPFLGEELIAHFGKNLFENEDLLQTADELLGYSEQKPLECVGTHEETIAAFYLSIKKHEEENRPLPVLLEKINQQMREKETNLEERSAKILSSWNEKNSVPEEIVQILKQYV